MQMPQTSSENFARRSATSLKRTNSTSGITGANGSRYFSLCVVATEPMRAPVEAVLQREKPRADASALRAQQRRMRARQLQRRLPGLGAASCRRRRGPAR